MIEVIVNRPSFEYDIHSLVKAFFPREDVQVRVQDTFTDDTKIRMTVHFTDDQVSFSVTEDGCLKENWEQAIDYSDRKETKNHLKRLIYRKLSNYTGQELPWGTLTGIRPTKIAMGLLEQGKRNVEIAEYMRNTYLASKEKVALSVMIANREQYVLRNIDYKDGYSLYVGIPFCPSICLYCSFSSYPLERWRKRVDEYLDALCKELDYLSSRFRHKKLNTVYIGGGTPTTLEPYQLDRLLTKIQSCFDTEHLQEFTVEAGRPDSITEEKLKVLASHGISRISINPQTMNQKTLDLIGRRHTVENVKEKFHIARELGFDNINMDLIMGLPGEDLDDVKHTLEEIEALKPDSLTVHSLAIKRAARLNMFKEEYADLKINNTPEMIALSEACARRMGMEPYYLYRQKNMAGNFENVGYSLPGKACIYNILIMEEMQTIAACGAGTTTKVVFPSENRRERCENVKEVEQYISRIDEMIGRKEKIIH